MAFSDTLEWRQARQWLINTGVIPPTHRVTKPDVDLVDFARSLRDGVFLCSLLEKVKPGSCADWNPKPLMQHSFLKNIQTFLHALTSSLGFEESDLFADSDLYDADNFKKVMHTLSCLSQVPEALSLGWTPFPKEEVNADYMNDPDEIYAQLKDISLTGSNRLYSNIGADEIKENPYMHGDESIYDCVCYYQRPVPVQKLPSDCDEKRVHILDELHTTEQNFLQALNVIVENFCGQLQSHITTEDTDLLFSTVKSIVPVHKILLGTFTERPGSTEIARVFREQREGLLLYGSYAAKLPLAVAKAKDLQNRADLAKVFQSCMEKSCQKFALSDLLSVPVQRVLKYPLLVKELLKCAKKGSASQQELNTLETLLSSLEDIAKYINATKGDFETIKSVKEVEASLSNYNGPSLLQFGRYCLDGELKVKLGDQAQPKSKWVFLFDKVLMICKKVAIRLGLDVRYVFKRELMVSNIHVELVNSLNPTNKGKAFKILVERASGIPLTLQSSPLCEEFLCFAKTEELRSQWVDAINHAREVTMPREGKKGNHKFELSTFESPSSCFLCNKLLHGTYFQGYTCAVCKKCAHYECLGEVPLCQSGSSPIQATKSRPHKQLAGSQSLGEPPRSPGLKRQSNTMNGGSTFTSQIFVAKQRYDAIGTRKNRVLCFEKGEELEVLNASPLFEWWEAVSLNTGNRGEVPASYLKPAAVADNELQHHVPVTKKAVAVDPMEEKLKLFPWYVGKMSRIQAEQALSKMRDGVFLIRESDARAGEYAIALKWKGMPKHIKIAKQSDTKRFYVADICEFSSIDELVGHYQHTSLGSSFPGVDTTLQYSLKDKDALATTSLAAPQPPLPPTGSHHMACSWAEALFSFGAEYDDELSFRKHDEVKIIEKETNKLGWWYGECKGQVGLFPSNYVRERMKHN